MNLDPISDWLNLILVVVGIVGGVVALVRLMLKSLEKKIEEETRQIRTDANGGQSLNDVNKRVGDLSRFFHDYVREQREVDRKRDGQIEELRYEIGIAKRLGAWPNGE